MSDTPDPKTELVTLFIPRDVLDTLFELVHKSMNADEAVLSDISKADPNKARAFQYIAQALAHPAKVPPFVKIDEKFAVTGGPPTG